ncbi:YdcF family protein [Noviherbaspirillum sp. ST9]|uniref:YdcF family protein n=1 Tax=Noviherbaspirillum sp. ST9 TaxID=3401606 RepID=UPI003B587648
MTTDLQALLREMILPPASLFVLLALGLMLWSRHPRLGRLFAGGAVAALYVLCTGFGATALVTPLEGRTRPFTGAKDSGAQAIVVLAAGRVEDAPEYGGDEQPDYIALARLRYAARLHRATGLPILVSGGNGTEDGRYKSKALAMERALREEFAVPVRWLETASANTAQNAAFSARILEKENLRRILLVTDAMHMPRSVIEFERHGMEVIAAPTVFLGGGTLSPMMLLPSAENLRRSYYAMYEWIGLAWYAARNSIGRPPT